MKHWTRLNRIVAAATSVPILVIGMSVPAQAAGTVTNNLNGSITASGLSQISSEYLFLCAPTVTASTCLDPANSNVQFIIDSDGTYQGGSQVRAGNTGTPLPAGTYNMAVGYFSGGWQYRTGTALSGVVIAGGGNAHPIAPAAVTSTLTLDFAASNATCTGTTPSGIQGSWLTLPSADQCTQSGPAVKPSTKLLGWSTSANFPRARAQSQIDKGWGVVDEEINGIRMIFIPAGGATFISGDNSLHSIWSE